MKKLQWNIGLVILSIMTFWSVQPSKAQNFAKPSNLIANVKARDGFCLDGKWRMIIDPYESGYLNYRLKPYENVKQSFAGNVKPQRPSDLIEYDFDKSPQINVPGDWNTQRPELLYYEGTLWYKKSFNIVKKPGHRYFIYFGGINYESNIYLNARHIGDHIGGFTSFDFEVTDQLNDGDNFIVVHANNMRHRDGVPTVNTDWWNYGGITRSVYLVETPETFVQDYLIQLEKGQTDQITGWVKLNGPHPAKDVTVAIPELKFSKTFEVDEQGMAKVSFKIKAQLWSPENPKLYEVNISAGQDQITDRIGFRTIEARGNDILLNGKSMYSARCMHP